MEISPCAYFLSRTTRGCPPRSRALRAENFAVDIAENGEDGGTLGATEHFDVAVLDLGLPKVDGVSVLRSWRNGGRAAGLILTRGTDGRRRWRRASRRERTTI